MSKVAIIGGGFVGRAWAISFARAGHAVALWDADAAAPAKALAYIDAVLPDLVANDLLGGASAAELRARLHPIDDLGTALAGAVHVQENTPEDVAVKREIFARLDALAAPDAVLASSTSAILPSAFTESLPGRARCLVVHPINPPYLVPAAEVVPAPWTDSAIVERAAAFLRAAGHAPIVMKRELDGFVMNRLQGALLEEAFRLVADGYAGVEDVGIGIREGLALRWSFMGPFETIDLNAPAGVRDYAERYQSIYAGVADWDRRACSSGIASRGRARHFREARPGDSSARAEPLVDRHEGEPHRLRRRETAGEVDQRSLRRDARNQAHDGLHHLPDGADRRRYQGGRQEGDGRARASSLTRAATPSGISPFRSAASPRCAIGSPPRGRRFRGRRARNATARASSPS